LNREARNGGLLKSGLINLLKFIFEGKGDDPVSHLKEDYAREKALATRLREHARSMPYDFYRDQLLKLAETNEKAAEELESKIRAMDGSLPQTPEPEPMEGTLWEKLAGDVDELSSLCYSYLSHAGEHEDEVLIGLLMRLRSEKNEESLIIQRLASGLHGYAL
jgi:hypothetical protein